MCVCEVIRPKKNNRKYIFSLVRDNKQTNSNKRFFCHPLFSGLCTILRSEAGGQDDVVSRGGADEPDYRNNSHLLPPDAATGRSNHVGYYDAAALYPSSGEPTLAFFFHPLHSDGGGGWRTTLERDPGRDARPRPLPPLSAPLPPHATPPCFRKTKKALGNSL
jgi:hypothetical protein